MPYVFALVSALERLRDCRQRVAGFDQASRLSNIPGIKENIESNLQYAEKQFKEFELDAPLDRLAHIRIQLGVDCAFGVLDTELRVLNQAAEDQIVRRHWAYIPLKKSEFYFEVPDLFPVEILAVFHGVGEDIREACMCYALDRNTACVFHCMGILQYGLYDLAKRLEIPFSDTLDLENWKTIIDQIESKIRALESMKKSREKDQKLTFYSNVAVQFRYFKDAWRNHVAHLRETYDADQAHSILIHVRDFMKQLAAPEIAEIVEAIEKAKAAKDSEPKP